MSNQIPFTPPKFEADAFNCPFCHAYSNMIWYEAKGKNGYRNIYIELDSVDFARCNHCQYTSIWNEEEMIYPANLVVEDPNTDLPDEVKKDYIEAAVVLNNSPRGAAALLRLAIQKLCDSLVKGDGDLNSKIGSLVKNGLDEKVQKALDAVRVIGNEAVHPGLIELNDTPEIANQLFKLVNLIGRRMITEPKEVDDIYGALPVAKIKGIEARDKAE